MSQIAIPGLSSNELCAGVIAIGFVGFFYLLRDQLDEWAQDDAQMPWRWGDKQRRSRKPATWGTHMVLAFPTALLVIFTIGILRRM